MEYTINQLFDLLGEKVYAVRDTFIGFFGEDYIDLHEGPDIIMFKQNLHDILEEDYHIKPRIEVKEGALYDISEDTMNHLKGRISHFGWDIYVWWPVVTVTNEYDKSIIIQDLYAKITVQTDGRIPYESHGFYLNRATYPIVQFQSNYLHSHVRDIPKSDFTYFASPCLGTGPINQTILTLKSEYEETTWMLFCQELSMYVTVESLTGIPYNRLETVVTRGSSILKMGFDFCHAMRVAFIQSGFSTEKLKDCIKYYLQHGHLSLVFKDNRFQCGLSYYEYILDLSNAFIDFYNENLCRGNSQIARCFSSGLLMEVNVVNGKFYRNTDHIPQPCLEEFKNKPVLTFKGKEIKTNIIGEKEEKAVATTILCQEFAMYVLKNILRTINFRFNNEHNESNNTTSAYKRVCYI